MPKGYPKAKETMTDLLSRFMATPAAAMTAEEMTQERPKLRAAYVEFKKRKKEKRA